MVIFCMQIRESERETENIDVRVEKRNGICYTTCIKNEERNRIDGVNMVKKLDICGMQIDNYTAREAIMQVEIYLNNTVMNTIETINMKMLDLAGEDETVRECIDLLDLAVIGEKDILIAAGVNSTQRIRETVEHDFFREFLKRIIRNHKHVFLLGETTAEVDELSDYLFEEYERLQIGGRCALEEKAGDNESVVNEINSVSPDVIFSILPSPMQEAFLIENKGKLSASIWYGLGDGYQTHSGIARISKIVGKLIHRNKLKLRLHKYQNDNENEDM